MKLWHEAMAVLGQHSIPNWRIYKFPSCVEGFSHTLPRYPNLLDLYVIVSSLTKVRTSCWSPPGPPFLKGGRALLWRLRLIVVTACVCF